MVQILVNKLEKNLSYPFYRLKGIKFFYYFILVLFSMTCLANPIINQLPSSWNSFKPILNNRLKQKNPKMKLNNEQVVGFVNFLNHLESPTHNLSTLQSILPKTTLELLRTVYERGLELLEAEKMADYLDTLVKQYNFKNTAAFDENTSHIIGREWNEIDYTGEGMTWEKQKLKYQPYGITNFKSLENLTKFFKVESKLPYFNKIYQPQY